MSVADLEARIDDWVQSNAEWTDDPTDHTLSERNTEMDGSGATYYATDVRFLLTDAKSILLQKFTDKLKDKVAWFRVGYHECTHHPLDEPNQPCSFDPAEEPTADATEETFGTAIPSGVPDFPEEAY